jgi:uncharacterized protein
VRLEFPLRLLPNLTTVHRDLKLHFGTARTFCVCSGGQLAPYRIGKMFVLEGHSDPTHEGKWTNFAVTARLSANSAWRGETLLKEVSRRVIHESGGLPIRQGLSEYLSDQGRQSERESSITYWRWGEIDACFPPDVAATVREAVRFLAERLFPRSDWDKVSVYAPELDYYWPFPTAAGFEVGPNLFIAGDASGQYRGILQAFCAGRELAATLEGSAC